MKKFSLIITAGGTSSRYGNTNKLLEKINDKTVIEETVSKFVDLSSTKGVTRVNNLSFQATDYDDKCNELMAELAGKAKRRANATLNPLNMQVLTVKSISTSCSQSSSYSPVNYAKSARALGASEEDKETSTTPIEAGKIILNGSLNTTFYIGAKK